MSDKWEVPLSGWIISEIRGQSWFSDGHAMFRGKPPAGPTRRIEKVKGKRVKRPFEYALRGIMTKRLRRTSVLQICRNSWNQNITTVILKGPTCVNAIFCDYATKHFPGVQFYLGNRQRPNYYPLICKVGCKLVGAIMPMDFPPGKLPKP